MPNLNYHPLLREIIDNIDFKKIGSPSNLNISINYSSSTRKSYKGDTIFEGKWNGQGSWISVNIIEGSDELYLHTNLKLINGKTSTLLVTTLNGFNINKRTMLFKVGCLSLGKKNLISIIENQILPNLK